MKIILCFIAAISGYLIGGINPAIVLSKAIYHKDIRTLGSKNPGFTNFKRVFGPKYAWFVFLLDILKSAILCLIFSRSFEIVFGSFSLGAAYTGFFTMLGHCFPLWYNFKGGKAFLAGAAAIWFIDYRVAAIAAGVMLILLFTTKYMSLSVIISAAMCPVMLIIFGTDNPFTVIICLLSVALLIWRHKENIKRLMNKSETKFSLFGKNKSR